MPTQQHHTSQHRVAVAVAALLAAGLSGCRSTEVQTKTGRLDRLMTTYPALGSGRFVVIADFEDTQHMELVTLRATSPAAKFAYDTRHGRRDTGPGCLKITATSPADTIIFSNRASATWYLKRDWRDFDTLLLAVNAPRDGLSEDVVVRSGTGSAQRSGATTHKLRKGWNVLRIDLAEIAEQIAIDDVHDIQISFAGLAEPTELYLDDVLLTSDRTMVFGRDTTTPGALYVQRIGHRLHIGTGSAFELTFAQAQIVSWFDLKADPLRLHDLSRGTTLGPRPIVLDAGGKNSSDFRPLGRAVRTEQRLLEANAVRTVIECVWRFVSDSEQPTGNEPVHRRRYTIYPTGQVYVSVDAVVATDSWQPPQVGLSVRMALPQSGTVSAYVPPPESIGASTPPYGWLTADGLHTRLLFVVGSDGAPLLLSPHREPGGPATLVAVDDQQTGATRSWWCHLWLTTFDERFEETAVARAQDFLSPPRLEMDVGSVGAWSDRPGTAGGFDRGTGSYVLVPDDGRIRLVMRPKVRHAINPCFTVSRTTGHDAWVYVNNILHESVARNRDGEIIFQLREPIRKTTLIEVIVRRGATVSGS